MIDDFVDAALRMKMNKIMASDYFTTTPEMKATVEMAAAAGNYTSFQVPVNGSVVAESVPVQVDGQYQQKVITVILKLRHW